MSKVCILDSFTGGILCSVPCTVPDSYYVSNFRGNAPGQYAWSPTARWLAVLPPNTPAVQIIDSVSGNIVNTVAVLTEPASWVQRVEFAADGLLFDTCGRSQDPVAFIADFSCCAFSLI